MLAAGERRLNVPTKGDLGRAGRKKGSDTTHLSLFHPLLTPTPTMRSQLIPFVKLPRSSTPPSPGIVVLCSPPLPSLLIRKKCASFGGLHAFRPDFLQARGVVFVSYFDERSAQSASQSLAALLSSEGEGDVHAFYCVPLHFSQREDEGGILVKGLDDQVDEEDVQR